MSARARIANWLTDHTRVIRWAVVRALRMERRTGVCWSDAVTWAQGFDGPVGRDAFESLPGSALRCTNEAGRDGMCWCGKFACPERMAERGMNIGELRNPIVVTREGEVKK